MGFLGPAKRRGPHTFNGYRECEHCGSGWHCGARLGLYPFRCRVFVPEYTQELLLELQGCAANGSLGCPVHLTVGSATLPGNFQKVLTCSNSTQACRLLLSSPPWDRWLQVTAKSLAGPHVSVAFHAVAALTGGPRGEAALPPALHPRPFSS